MRTLFLQWIRTHGRLPQVEKRDSEEKRLGRWLQRYRSGGQAFQETAQIVRKQIDAVLEDKAAVDKANYSAQQLAKKYRLSQPVVRKMIKQAGIPISAYRHWGGKIYPLYSVEQFTKAMKRPDASLTKVSDVARMFKVYRTSLAEKMRRRGIKPATFVGIKDHYLTKEQIAQLKRSL